MRLLWFMLVILAISCNAVKRRKKFDGDFEFADDMVSLFIDSPYIQNCATLLLISDSNVLFQTSISSSVSNYLV